MSRYAQWLAVAIEAATKAAEVGRRAWRGEHIVRRKGLRDIVTETDLTMESTILTHLRRAFPDHAMTSEEAGADSSDAQVHWLVDPLDGTTNFARNNPNFSTSIAAVEEGVPVVGVIVDPLRSHLFAATAGGGATLNGEPIQVSGTTKMASAVFAVDLPREPVLRTQMWEIVGRFLSRGHTVRALGSAALNMAYVAAGWVDGYFSVAMQPWDQAAAALLVCEAGGVVATVMGEPWTPYRPDPLMVASAELRDAMLALFDAASRPAAEGQV